MVQRSARPARALLQGEQEASRSHQICSDHAFPDQGCEHIHAHTPNIFIAYSTVWGIIPTSIMGFKMPWASAGDTSTEDSALSSAQAAELKSNIEKVRV